MAGFVDLSEANYHHKSHTSHPSSNPNSNPNVFNTAASNESSRSFSYSPFEPDVPTREQYFVPQFDPRGNLTHHVYSIPKKNSKTFTSYLFEDAQHGYHVQDPSPMSCSLVPSQCDTSNCVQVAPKNDNEHAHFNSNQRALKKKSKCPFCGIDGVPDFIQHHINSCGIEGIVCSNCNDIVHRGIFNHHAQYLCTKRPVFCKSCGQNFIADQIQAHQSKCSLTNKNWSTNAQPNSRNSSNNNNNDIPLNKYPCDPQDLQNNPSSSPQPLNNSRSKSIPRAKSSDTFEHSSLRTQSTIQEAPIPSGCQVVSSNRASASTPSYLMDPMSSVVNGGYGALFAKLEMIDKQTDDRATPDEHVDVQSSAIVPCIFKDAGCHFQGTHYSLSRHLDESMKLHLAMTYSIMQHQQKQLLMVTSALAASMNPNNDGSVFWKIRGFNERLMEAKSGKRIELQSPVFYSSRFGYKLGLVLYPDGYGSAKGSHLSIFLKIHRGDFDTFLQWPFPHTIKLALLSQDQTRQHIVQRINQKFNIVTESNRIPSPRSGTNGSSSNQSVSSSSSSSSSGMIGLTRFVSQEMILSSQQYLMDETLCICATVLNADMNNNFRQPEVLPRTNEI